MVVAGLLHGRAARHRLGAQVLYHAGLRGEAQHMATGTSRLRARSRAAARAAPPAVDLAPVAELSPP